MPCTRAAFFTQAHIRKALDILHLTLYLQYGILMQIPHAPLSFVP